MKIKQAVTFQNYWLNNLQVPLTILLIIGILVPNRIFGQGRQCNISINIITPKPGDTIFSPSSYKTKMCIKNHGPDTVRTTDAVQIRTKFGNVLFSPFYSLMPKTIVSGDSAFIEYSLSMKFDLTNYGVPFCGTILKFYSTIAVDSIRPESIQQKINNNHCISVDHISHLTSIKSKSTNAIGHVFPNPATSQICFFSNFNFSEMKVFDIYGHLRTEFFNHTSDKKCEINVKMYPPGLYFIRVDTSTEVLKFMVIH